MQGFTLCWLIFFQTGCARYRFDARRATIQQPDAQVWAVGVQRSGAEYRIHSVTKLNGATHSNETPSILIAAGNTESWQWEIKAVPSLEASWKAWENDKKVQQRASDDHDWTHPAASWEQAFARSYKIVNYLLGRPPLSMKLTLLLLPEGSAYDKVFVETGTTTMPLTFAFYYPASASENKELTGLRFSALVEAVSRSVYEYQHLMDKTGIMKPVGKNETDITINDEARSHCWYDSTFLALTSGTNTSVVWEPVTPQTLMEASTHHDTSLETDEDRGPMQKSYLDGWLWGRYLESRSISAYLQKRNISNNRVVSNDPAAMNAVLSVCRAITQHQTDLTAGTYPVSQVEYVPFFPAIFKR